MKSKKRVLKFLPILFIFLITIFLLIQNIITTKDDNGVNNLSILDNNKPGNIGEVNNPVPVEGIILPDGFDIYYYASDLPNARSMTLSSGGIVYVGTRSEGKVYAVVDDNDDYIADKIFVVASGLKSPNGVAYKDGDLYVAEISRILKFKDIDKNYMNKPDYEVIKDDYPSDEAHGWKYIAFGPDNKLYVPVGAPCNICKRDESIYSTITSIATDGSEFSIAASGIRNSVGFDWHPITNELWFTDNGRDWMGDDLPPDELNKVSESGQNFGYPYCHGININDPEFGSNVDCSSYTPAEVELGPHVAALGITFYTGNMFPKEYKQKIFIAEHGSWNRSTPIGYRISTVDLTEDGSSANNYTNFATGWLNTNNKAWGRPVDIIQIEDGSILISDDKAGAIYRVMYKN
jgi:glucose/arabinose dehydrogenase